MKKKILPHLAGYRQWLYTAHSEHYSWTTTVRATTIQQARALGLREAKLVFGNHARVHRDELKPVE